MGTEYVLFLQGDFDLAAVQRVERGLREVIDRDRPETLLVDLSKVTFLECAGIGVLVRAHRRQRARGARLVVRNATGLPRKVLALTGAGATLGLEGPSDEGGRLCGMPPPVRARAV